MKKILVLFLAVLISVSSFAQEIKEEKNSAIFVDLGSTITAALLGGFGIGLGYEHKVADNISALVNVNYIGFTIDGGVYDDDLEFLGIAIGLGARYYPLNNPVKGLFVNIDGIYTYTNIKYGEVAISNLFELRLLAGWKFIFRSDFFLEPGISYTLAFGEVNLPTGSESVPPVGGPGFWLGLGFAF
jgi:hypothetical protein